MALQPWAIDGAKLSAAQARAMAFKQSGGARGVTLPGDLRVTALPTPGGAVRVAPGGATIPNDYPGGRGQSYGTLMIASEDVNVPATGSGGGATRYLIQRIIDPEFGGQTPPDPLTFRYDPFVLVSSITNLNYPYVPLAKIVQPANTAVITSAMITDIRKVANPRRWTDMRTHALVGSDSSVLQVTSAYPDGGQTWPPSTETAWGEIDIPEQATRMKIIMTWGGISVPAGESIGFLWVQVGATANPNNVKTQAVRYDSANATNHSRQVAFVANEIPIPKALRGTSQKFYPRGNATGGSAASRWKVDSSSNLRLDVEFMERAD